MIADDREGPIETAFKIDHGPSVGADLLRLRWLPQGWQRRGRAQTEPVEQVEVCSRCRPGSRRGNSSGPCMRR